MAGIYANLAVLMGQRNLSISRTPFNTEIVVIKRASFPKGEVPPKLRPFLITPGTGRGLTGTVVYRGKLVPKTAANIGETRRGRRA